MGRTKLHHGGWTLVNFGTYVTRYARSGYAKHFIPWTFIFVRPERTEAYRELFETTRSFANIMFKLDLTVTIGSLDHVTCITKAFITVWPDISLLTC